MEYGQNAWQIAVIPQSSLLYGTYAYRILPLASHIGICSLPVTEINLA